MLILIVCFSCNEKKSNSNSSTFVNKKQKIDSTKINPKEIKVI
jgi:hypothetical protein